MKILVLGKTGQLGSELVAQAPGRGFEVAGLGSDEIDVTTPASCEAALDATRPELVINTTAYHVVPDCDRFPGRALAVNAAAVQVLAQLCHGRGIGFATYSTDYVFDGLKGQPYLEDDRANPLQTYGVSKYAGEMLSLLFHPRGLVIRSCGVYGGSAGSRSRKGNFVLSILAASETKAEIEVSHEQIVNPTYAGDLAKATFDLVARKPEGGIYHLAADGYCSWAEFAAAIVSAAGRPARILPVDHGGRSGSLRRPLFSALGNEKARDLGVVLPHWRDGLQRYLTGLFTSR